MKKFDLSTRMKTVVDMVMPQGVVADIGCDHAYVSIYLIKYGIAKKVIASDVRSGPVEIASRNVREWELEDQIEIRIGDGLAPIKPYEVDTIILAGMGGILMNQILGQQEAVTLSARQLVLQPQSDMTLVRKKLRDMGATIVREDMIVDMGKYYTVIDARFLEDEKSEDESFEQELYDRYGAYLLQNRHPVLLSYLKKEHAKNENILKNLAKQDSENAKKKIEELEHLKRYIEAALSYYCP